jgi:hypothetical protein
MKCEVLQAFTKPKPQFFDSSFLLAAYAGRSDGSNSRRSSAALRTIPSGGAVVSPSVVT